MTVALVPYKGDDVGKSRLRESLEDGDRERLNRQMLDHVLRVLEAAPSVQRTIVLASEPLAGGETFVPSRPGLNLAIGEGLAHVFADRGTGRSLVLPADLPYATVEDIEIVLRQNACGVVVPSKDGGTGALVIYRDYTPVPNFGPDSANRHVEAFRLTGCEPTVLHRSGLALDIDTPEDLDLLGDSLLDFVWTGNGPDLYAGVE